MKETILILIGIVLIIFIILRLLYDRYYPYIDIIKGFNKYTIVLWYNKKLSKKTLGSRYKDEVVRTYTKLFEYEIK